MTSLRATGPPSPKFGRPCRSRARAGKRRLRRPALRVAHLEATCYANLTSLD